MEKGFGTGRSAPVWLNTTSVSANRPEEIKALFLSSIVAESLLRIYARLPYDFPPACGRLRPRGRAWDADIAYFGALRRNGCQRRG
jgi:hypothetical protein